MLAPAFSHLSGAGVRYQLRNHVPATAHQPQRGFEFFEPLACSYDTIVGSDVR